MRRQPRKNAIRLAFVSLCSLPVHLWQPYVQECVSAQTKGLEQAADAPTMSRLRNATLQDVAAMVLPWLRPNNKDPTLSQSGLPDPLQEAATRSRKLSDHQQVTRTCPELRDTEFWITAFILNWKREAWEPQHGPSITFRVRQTILRKTTSGPQTEPALPFLRKFAHF